MTPTAKGAPTPGRACRPLCDGVVNSTAGCSDVRPRVSDGRSVWLSFSRPLISRSVSHVSGALVRRGREAWRLSWVTLALGLRTRLTLWLQLQLQLWLRHLEADVSLCTCAAAWCSSPLLGSGREREAGSRFDAYWQRSQRTTASSPHHYPECASLRAKV